jgi:hypothetical protein
MTMSNGYQRNTQIYAETRQEIEIPKEYVIQTLQTEFPYLLELQRILSEINYGNVTLDITVRGGKAEKMEFYNEKRSWMKQNPSLIENLKVDGRMQ